MLWYLLWIDFNISWSTIGQLIDDFLWILAVTDKQYSDDQVYVLF